MKVDLSWKEVGLVALAVALNAAVLTLLVSGPDGRLSAAFAQPYDLGETCIDPTDCISGNCVQDVCCNSACTLSGQTCNLPGSVGTCVSPSQAPTLSFPLQWFAAGLVGLISILRLRRRFR